jgi:hypothetical protein
MVAIFLLRPGGPSGIRATKSGRHQTRVPRHPQGGGPLRRRAGASRATAGRSGVCRGYELALQGLRELPYDKWREYDAEDTVRFYALRLREAGFIRSSPQKIIADGTDWRFPDELKRELKA